jgi:hypothetical protein
MYQLLITVFVFSVVSLLLIRHLFWKIFLIVKNVMFDLWFEIKSFVYSIFEAWRVPAAVVSAHTVNVDTTLVNPVKNGVQYQDCPLVVYVTRRVNRTVEIEFGGLNFENGIWYSFPSVSFYVGSRTGRIKEIWLDYAWVNTRGNWFRNACGTTDWPKYYTSVVLAHLEVLKFNQRRRSHHPTVISRVFKQYGEQIFGHMPGA